MLMRPAIWLAWQWARLTLLAVEMWYPRPQWQCMCHPHEDCERCARISKWLNRKRTNSPYEYEIWGGDTDKRYTPIDFRRTAFGR